MRLNEPTAIPDSAITGRATTVTVTVMADFDGDGEINVFDASAILKRLVGLA